MPELRPKKILRDIGRQWPDAWKQIRMIRAEKGKSIPDWPDWCYVPIAAGYAVVTQGGSPNEMLCDHKLSPAVVTAAASWRVSKGIYRYDQDLYYSLLNQPLDGNLPCEVLKRLPEYCVYIETYNVSFLSIPVMGFWAHLEHDTHDARMELRFVFMCEDGRNMPIAIHMGNWTLEEGLERMRTVAKKHAPANYVSVEDYVGDMSPFVQLVLYLCAENADMPVKPSHPSRRVRLSGAIDAPKEPRVWMVGERIGAAIRKYRNEQQCEFKGETHSSPRPHIRRAHYHHFWKGPLQGERELVLRWLPPIPVGVDGGDEIPTVIHMVK